MPPDWDNLARHLRAARGERSLAEVALDCSILEGSILNLEHGEHPASGGISPAVYKLALYYGWTRDSVHDMLAGGEPTPLADDWGNGC